MNLEKARKAFLHDPQYHNLVDVLVRQIEELQLAPNEIREAAMFACLIVEERSTHPPLVLDFADVEKRAVAIHLKDLESLQHKQGGEHETTSPL